MNNTNDAATGVPRARVTMLVLAIGVAAFAFGVFCCTTNVDVPAIKDQTGEGTTVNDKGVLYGHRIVSLAPSITEILFYLELGHRVVGVTRFCDYPQAALSLPKVGGYYDPNFEAIVSVRPDVVILLEEHKETQRFLIEAGINTLLVSNRTVENIYESLRRIGKLGHKEELAEERIRSLKKRVARVKQKNERSTPIRIMISTGRNMGTGTVKDAYIAGGGGLYQEMITFVGGVNAYTGDLAFPLVTREGIVRMNPSVIVDAVADHSNSAISSAEIVAEWNQLRGVDAVQQGNVHVLTNDYVVVPGPRFILMLEQLSQIVTLAQKKEIQ